MRRFLTCNFQLLTSNSLRRSAGFTLVEIAMVLVIIGMLIGLGAGLVGPLVKRAKLTETRETVKEAYNAIIGYTVANKRLPASLSNLSTKTKDAYTQDLFYYPAGGITGSNLCTTQGTYLNVDDKGSNKTNVAFIIFSEGDNRCNQTGSASPFNIMDEGTTAACPQDPNAGYDDIVMYADIDNLRKQICSAFQITTDSLPIGTEEVAYPSTTLEATDGTMPYTWSVSSGSLPPGLTLSSAGVISGTPTIDGGYNFTMQVQDNDAPQRSATKSLAITINPNKPRITTEFLTYGTVGQSYPSTTLSATGGKPSYTWSLVSGSLPPGLSLSGGGISGTPTVAGTYAFTVRATDSGSPARTADKTLSIAINQ